ncbi:MAG: nitronate monooxygenase family protein [Rhodospirillaceae bacterium]|nr:nitronate monooxygenase family protein [Rhodospirillaceae bacterium]
MALPDIFRGRLTVPVVGAPMFLVSHPELVIAQCQAGIAGSFPTLNARPLEVLDQWLKRITDTLAASPKAAPFGVNLVVHKANTRLAEDFALTEKYKVPFVVTSVGEPGDLVKRVHGYGGIVFHDVTTVRHAKKAIAAGVDGLILVCAGAGGHAGTASPFALVEEVRKIFKGVIILAGAISTGAHVKAAQAIGADLAYMGTRMIATQEATADAGYKQMIVDSSAADIVYTPHFSGVPASYLRGSIVAAGLDPDKVLGPREGASLGLEEKDDKGPKAWRDIWSAGQGVGAIGDIPSVADLVARLKAEYDAVKI